MSDRPPPPLPQRNAQARTQSLVWTTPHTVRIDSYLARAFPTMERSGRRAAAAAAGAGSPPTRQPSGMAQLRDLALRYQRTLGSVNGFTRSDAATQAGLALVESLDAAVTAAGAVPDPWQAFEPVMHETALAASIVAYWERLPWTALTPQQLCEQTFLSNTMVDCMILCTLAQCADVADDRSPDASPMASSLLKQVAPPPAAHSFRMIALIWKHYHPCALHSAALEAALAYTRPGTRLR